MKHRALIAIIFLIGCATGGVASQLVAPVVPAARAGTNPTRWEYFCLTVNHRQGSLTAEMNKAGAAGWELVSVAPQQSIARGYSSDEGMLFCAKRALP